MAEVVHASTYVDDYGYGHDQRASVTVHDEPRSAKVTYRGKRGSTFSVIVHQKPNPIGFHARLPGDTPKPTPGSTGPRPVY